MSNLLKIPRVNTHKASILYLLLKGNKIRNKQMWGYIDSGYSASRLSELRADFWPIDTTSHWTVTKENKRVSVKEYFIKSIHLSELMKMEDVRDFILKYEMVNLKKVG